MAKRKRLSPAILSSSTASADSSTTAARPPIANVAGEAAEHAALVDVAHALTQARAEGRLIQKLPLAQIETGHLVRDRVAFDEAEMTALRDSLAARGQQVPVEVVALADGRFGLISGLRRVMALRALAADDVLALVRQPETSADAYLAMVEENEIRAGISFYERARLAAKAAELGIYDSAASAIAALFASASAAKRSKIGSFVRLHNSLGDVLRFPAAIPERLGLALAAAVDAGAGAALRAALETAAPASAETERKVLEDALRAQGAAPAKPQANPQEIAPGITLEAKSGRVVLSGKGVTPALRQALEEWLKTRH